jgi:transcription initiation factor TFIIIB Brf1 subunit/transcription initiation factor TFIIB
MSIPAATAAAAVGVVAPAPAPAPCQHVVGISDGAEVCIKCGTVIGQVVFRGQEWFADDDGKEQSRTAYASAFFADAASTAPSTTKKLTDIYHECGRIASLLGITSADRILDPARLLAKRAVISTASSTTAATAATPSSATAYTPYTAATTATDTSAAADFDAYRGYGRGAPLRNRRFDTRSLACAAILVVCDDIGHPLDMLDMLDIRVRDCDEKDMRTNINRRMRDINDVRQSNRARDVHRDARHTTRADDDAAKSVLERALNADDAHTLAILKSMQSTMIAADDAANSNVTWSDALAKFNALNALNAASSSSSSSSSASAFATVSAAPSSPPLSPSSVRLCAIRTNVAKRYETWTRRFCLGRGSMGDTLWPGAHSTQWRNSELICHLARQVGYASMMQGSARTIAATTIYFALVFFASNHLKSASSVAAASSSASASVASSVAAASSASASHLTLVASVTNVTESTLQTMYDRLIRAGADHKGKLLREAAMHVAASPAPPPSPSASPSSPPSSGMDASFFSTAAVSRIALGKRKRTFMKGVAIVGGGRGMNTSSDLVRPRPMPMPMPRPRPMSVVPMAESKTSKSKSKSSTSKKSVKRRSKVKSSKVKVKVKPKSKYKSKSKSKFKSKPKSKSAKPKSKSKSTASAMLVDPPPPLTLPLPNAAAASVAQLAATIERVYVEMRALRKPVHPFAIDPYAHVLRGIDECHVHIRLLMGQGEGDADFNGYADAAATCLDIQTALRSRLAHHAAAIATGKAKARLVAEFDLVTNFKAECILPTNTLRRPRQ